MLVGTYATFPMFNVCELTFAILIYAVLICSLFNLRIHNDALIYVVFIYNMNTPRKLVRVSFRVLWGSFSFLYYFKYISYLLYALKYRHFLYLLSSCCRSPFLPSWITFPFEAVRPPITAKPLLERSQMIRSHLSYAL